MTPSAVPQVLTPQALARMQALASMFGSSQQPAQISDETPTVDASAQAPPAPTLNQPQTQLPTQGTQQNAPTQGPQSAPSAGDAAAAAFFAPGSIARAAGSGTQQTSPATPGAVPSDTTNSLTPSAPTLSQPHAAQQTPRNAPDPTFGGARGPQQGAPTVQPARPMSTGPQPGYPGAPATPPFFAPGGISGAVRGQTPTPVAASPSAPAGQTPTASNASAPDFASEYRDWRKAEPQAPNRDDFKTSVLRKLFGIGTAAVVGGLSRNPQAGVQVGDAIMSSPFNRAEKKYEQAHGTWERQGPQIAEQGRLDQLHQQIADSEATAQRQQDTRTLDQMYTDAVRGGDAGKQQEILQAIHELKGADRTEETPFSSWRGQNPQAPIADYFKVEKGTKTFSSPFEAFAYGSPDEKNAAKEFLTIEGGQKRLDRAPSEIEQRYNLYRSDPAAYKAMFSDRGTAQDQAQGTRMLKFFDGRRKEIGNDFTLDDATKQQRLAEIDELEKPYLDAAGTQGTPPTAAPSHGAPKPERNAGGAQPGEVEVISPTGQRGYIPQANLQKALQRGYKQAPAQ